ncbi:MAG: alpha/beta hydrolase [Deltaproteobacteria bacterium]|nr:MAG: alpha/beta hydrolase [Deltaproteobacteria bacterium]
MGTLPIILLVLFGVVVVFALLGWSYIESISIPTPEPTMKQTFGAGKHRVEYKSKGKKLVANLYIPENLKEGEKRPAIVIAPPATSVKEQSAHVYADKFCKLGYITLAYDPRGIGESEGIDCDSNPYVSANDMASSVSFLSSLPQVDSDKLLNVGICAGVLSAAYETIHDARIKALGIVVPSIVGSEMTKGNIFLVRWIIYVIGGITKFLSFFGINLKAPSIPPEDKLTEGTFQGLLEVATYYPEGKVGYHPRWKNSIAVASLPGVAKLDINNDVDRFDEVPVFMVSGENAYSLEPAMRFYNALNGPKDSVVLKDANHVEFYWKHEYADQAVACMNTFFQAQLGQG